MQATAPPLLRGILSTLPAGTSIALALGLGGLLRGVTEECDARAAALAPRFLECSFEQDKLSSAEIDAAVRAAGEAANSAAAAAAPPPPPLLRLDGALLAATARAGPTLLLAQDLCGVCAPGPALVAKALDELAAAEPAARAAVATVVLRAASLEGLYADVRAVAAAAGVAARGDEVEAALRARVDAARVRVAGRRRPRVAAVEWLEPIFGVGHWVPECISAAGGEEVMGGGPGSTSVALGNDALAKSAPDVVLLMPCGFTAERAAREGRAALPRILPAGFAGQVWAVDARRLFSGAAVELVEGVETLAVILHGSEEERAALAQGTAVRVA
jgi:iron complex transport system substrate-binding protein